MSEAQNKKPSARNPSSPNTDHKLEHVDIELTKQCNLNCHHCSARRNTKGDELSIDQSKKILREAQLLGLKQVGLTGGEPFLRRKKLMELMSFCKNKLKAPVHVHTNGILIGDKEAQELKQSTEEVTISLYGLTSKTHDFTTQVRGSMKSTWNGIQSLLKANTNVTIYTVPMKHNLQEIIPLIKKVSKEGCKKIRILSLSPTGKATENYDKLSLSNDETMWLNKKLNRVQKEIETKLYAGFCTSNFYPKLKMLPGHDSCYAAENRVHIDAFGNVFPCTASSGRMIFSAGNLQVRGYTLAEIWHYSPLFQFLREFHSNPPSKCQQCKLHRKCMSGCRVIMSYEYGDVTVADPQCGGSARVS